MSNSLHARENVSWPDNAAGERFSVAKTTKPFSCSGKGLSI
jgi:hypothetical protein